MLSEPRCLYGISITVMILIFSTTRENEKSNMWDYGFWIGLYRISGWPDKRISGETVEQMMRTSNEQTFFQNLFTKYKNKFYIFKNINFMFTISRISGIRPNWISGIRQNYWPDIRPNESGTSLNLNWSFLNVLQSFLN